ncbi:MAG: hypothetical protein JXJ19_01750 [Elusimicrobia bacterium]|nr:hypothetical protein [Elusimicrobiota bacterium]
MIMNNNRLLPVISFIMLLVFFSAGVLQFPESIQGSISLIRLTVGGPAKTISILNNYILKITQTGELEKTGAAVPSENRGNAEKLFEMLFLALNSILISNNKIIIELMSVFIGGTEIAVRAGILGRKTGIYGDVRQYTVRMFCFITPVRRCVEMLYDMHDPDPSVRKRHAIEVGGSPYYISDNTGILLLREEQ